ncbi:tetratricopeptide repeat-containing sensor histidine kinase [Flavobacterium sp.]
MKKSYYLFFVFLFLSCSKNKKINASEKSTSDSINYYVNSYSDKGFSQKEKLQRIDRAYQLVLIGKNSKENRDNLSKIILEYYNLGDFDKLKKGSKQLLKKSKLAKDTLSIAKSFRYLGGVYKYSGVLDSSFYYYTKAEEIYYSKGDNLSLGNILLNKGIVQFTANDYLGAELSLSKAYSIYKETNEYDKVYAALNQLGLTYNELSEFNKAINYHTKALEIIKKYQLQNDQHQEAICYNNLGYLFTKQKKFNEAIKNFKLGLKDKDISKDDPDLYALLLDNLGYARLQQSNFEDLPYLFLESLRIRQQLKKTSVIITSYIHLSEYYQKKGESNVAIKYSQTALKIAKNNNNPVDLLFALKQASVVDNKNAAKYSDDYLRITDSLQLVERQSKDRFNKIRFETDEIIQENDALENRNRRLLYIFVISFVLVALLFIVRAQRARTRELLYKQTQQKANEEIFNLMMSQQSIIDESRNKEKKRMAQDLHDGVLGRMFGLRLNLDSLNSSNDPDAVQKRLELLNELKTIEQDIREISHDLNREKMVLINNFVSIVHNLLEEQKSSHPAEVDYSIEAKIDWDKIGNAIKINMYRILQEGLQNINKYANAKHIKVEINGDKENVYLKIQDDGIGFDVNKKSKGIGMQNMISRTHDCQGIIDISSKKGEGTRIIITVPIETNQPTPKTA